MPDETTTEQLRIAHRRGHDTLMHERAREDVARANVLVADNAVLEIGELFDGEMLVVDGDQIVSQPIPGGGGGSVNVGVGLDGDGSVGDPLVVVFGTTAGTATQGNDARVTGALQTSALGSGVATFLGTPSSANLAAALTDETGTGALVFGTSPTLTTPMLAGGTALQLLRINSGGTAIEAYTPVTSTTVLTTPVTVTTSDQTILSFSLATAGTYQIDLEFVLRTTAATSQIFTFTLAGSGATLLYGRTLQSGFSVNTNITATTPGTATFTAGGAWTQTIASSGTHSWYKPIAQFSVASSTTVTMAIRSTVTSIAEVYAGVGQLRKLS